MLAHGCEEGDITMLEWRCHTSWSVTAIVKLALGAASAARPARLALAARGGARCAGLGARGAAGQGAGSQVGRDAASVRP